MAGKGLRSLRLTGSAIPGWTVARRELTRLAGFQAKRKLAGGAFVAGFGCRGDLGPDQPSRQFPGVPTVN